MVADNDGALMDCSNVKGRLLVIVISPVVFVTLVCFPSKEYQSILVNVKNKTIESSFEDFTVVNNTSF